MASHILALCVSALFVQTISSQCIGRPAIYEGPMIPETILPTNIPCGPYISGPDFITPDNAAVFNGGGFRVTSYSSAAPTGIKVQSDDLIVEGPLTVNGQLPFLGVVTIEGPLPAVGEGTVAYGCGNGNVGIINEGLVNGYGMTTGIAGMGCNGIPVGPIY